MTSDTDLDLICPGAETEPGGNRRPAERCGVCPVAQYDR